MLDQSKNCFNLLTFDNLMHYSISFFCCLNYYKKNEYKFIRRNMLQSIYWYWFIITFFNFLYFSYFSWNFYISLFKTCQIICICQMKTELIKLFNFYFINKFLLTYILIFFLWVINNQLGSIYHNINLQVTNNNLILVKENYIKIMKQVKLYV